jgi:putative transposase
MPRVARIELAGGVHHVTTRGNGKQQVFRDAIDCHVFTRLLRRAVERYGWTCLTYCLMVNHFHLLVLTPDATLGAGMHRLNGRYAQHFNQRHGRAGHVWGDRYHSVLLREDAHLLQAIAYIALNPVRAGLCSGPEDWPWSAHRALLGRAPSGFVATDQTLAYFAAFGGDGRARYRSYVERNLKRDCPSLGVGLGESPALD